MCEAEFDRIFPCMSVCPRKKTDKTLLISNCYSYSRNMFMVNPLYKVIRFWLHLTLTLTFDLLSYFSIFDKSTVHLKSTGVINFIQFYEVMHFTRFYNSNKSVHNLTLTSDLVCYK